MLMVGIGGVWAEEKTNFVSVITAIDGSTNLTNGSRSATMSDGTVMSFALEAGNLFGQDECNTAWANSDVVTELNSVLSKSLTSSNYFPKTTANRNGQVNRLVTCTANLSSTSNCDASKYVTFYVALYTQTSSSTPTLTVSGFSSADYSYALAGGTGFTRVAAVSDIPCAKQDYTLVKVRGKLSNTKTAVVTFRSNNSSAITVEISSLRQRGG